MCCQRKNSEQLQAHKETVDFFLLFLESVRMDELSNKVICTVVFKICD